MCRYFDVTGNLLFTNSKIWEKIWDLPQLLTKLEAYTCATQQPTVTTPTLPRAYRSGSDAHLLVRGIPVDLDGSSPKSKARSPLSTCLVPLILSKFHYAKRRFSVTSKCRQMHGVLNVDKIKN
jgi:hypothetical protein